MRREETKPEANNNNLQTESDYDSGSLSVVLSLLRE